MEELPVENDLTYQTYGLDFTSLFRAFYENVIGGDWGDFVARLSHYWDVYSVIAIMLSFIFFIGFVYAKIRYGQLTDEYNAQIRRDEEEWSRRYGGSAQKNNRWEQVQTHVASSNPNDWRLAIIEADILLEETLGNAGFVGATIGEKLKTANRASFRTLQDAWEAHKVRNEIAHAGSDYVLTKKHAQEAVVQYERVFREFGVV